MCIFLLSSNFQIDRLLLFLFHPSAKDSKFFYLFKHLINISKVIASKTARRRDRKSNEWTNDRMICQGKMKGSNANNNFYNRHQFGVFVCEWLKLVFVEATILSLNFPLFFIFCLLIKTLTFVFLHPSPSRLEKVFYNVGIHPNSQKLKMRLYFFSIFSSNVSMSNTSPQPIPHVELCVCK